MENITEKMTIHGDSGVGKPCLTIEHNTTNKYPPEKRIFGSLFGRPSNSFSGVLVVNKNSLISKTDYNSSSDNNSSDNDDDNNISDDNNKHPRNIFGNIENELYIFREHNEKDKKIEQAERKAMLRAQKSKQFNKRNRK